MRVLLVSAHGADPAYGGAEHYVRTLGHGLRERGHEPTVLSAFPNRADPGLETHVVHDRDWRDDPVRRIRNHVGDATAIAWPGVRRVIEQQRPDLVATGNLSGIGTGIWHSAQRLGVPVVHYCHDYHLLCPRTSLVQPDGTPCAPSPLLCGARTRSLARHAGAVRRVLAGSEHLLRSHEPVFRHVPGGVIRLPVAPFGRAFEAPHRPAAVGYLGALTESKGLRLLLAAAPALARAGVALRVAGDGPLRDEVQAAPEVAYAGRVSGTGKTDFLAGCDLGVVPSLWQEPSGPPYVVNDWLAARRPVLVTRLGGLAEAAALPGVQAFEPATADGLVAAVLALRDDPAAFRALADAVPVVDGDADVRRWLDEHEAAFEAARR
jgi:glycosyltransferase involved in cell wall biosynthesis